VGDEMSYDFSKPPESASVYRYGKNKKSHLCFHQGNCAYAVAMFQDEKWKDYFKNHISFTFKKMPK
jgi:hypothetical protein